MVRMGYIQDELDLKLLVLYIMDRVAAPVDFSQLLDMALCDAGVDYFSLTSAVDHLVQTENLEKTDDLYTITEKGRRNSAICQNSLPVSVRGHCDDNLARLNDALRRQEQVQAEIVPDPEGTCHLKLRFQDDTGVLFTLELLLADTAQAQSIATRFREDPARIYHGLVALLTEPEQP